MGAPRPLFCHGNESNVKSRFSPFYPAMASSSWLRHWLSRCAMYAWQAKQKGSVSTPKRLISELKAEASWKLLRKSNKTHDSPPELNVITTQN